MTIKKYILLLLLLLPFVAGGQVRPTCRAHIVVADTMRLTDPEGVSDSVRFHLVCAESPDSMRWRPEHLFADPTATEQWVTLACDDTQRVWLTAYYGSANLFHWQEPGFVKTHTGYRYIETPADGDFCSPRSITMSQTPSQLCPEFNYPNYQHSILIRTDTLRCWGDSVPVMFNYDSTLMNQTMGMLHNAVRQIPYDSSYVPFYVDTIEMWNPMRNHTFILNTTHYNPIQGNPADDSVTGLPTFSYSWQIDDTAHIILSPTARPRYCDTSFFFTSIVLPREGGVAPRHNVGRHWFNSIPRPHGTAIFRFYETPAPYYHTDPFLCISRIEMLGSCYPTDSLLLSGSQCGCLVRDTAERAVCRQQLPYTWYGKTFAHPGSDTLRIRSFACDTLRTLVVRLLPDDTITAADTIVENRLPWTAYGHTFSGPTVDTLLLYGVLPECDTLVYYRLVVHPNVFDTTYTYLCPGQLPYNCQEALVQGDTVISVVLQGSLGQDSTVTHYYYVKADSDTSVYDTVIESQLPRLFMDSLFWDSVDGCTFVTYNEAGCDSVIHYHLHVFWNSDHCDSLLQFPNFVTPNGDGSNDRFVISGLVENQCYPYNTLIIIDRTGRQVFRADNICRDDQFWDPAANRAPAGTYFYRFSGHGIHHTTQHYGCIEVLK